MSPAATPSGSASRCCDTLSPATTPSGGASRRGAEQALGPQCHPPGVVRGQGGHGARGGLSLHGCGHVAQRRGGH
ncbi:hypothetical protein GZL_05455 [Streptomyces sp. 769]|nr:hypothetical protein GZL_05455 [Streptomyces sp. 769]